MICPRVVKDKRPSSVQSEEDDVPARTCGIRRKERTCAHEHSYLIYGMADQVIDSLFQLLVKNDHKFTLTSQWFGQFTVYLLDFSYLYPYSLLRILSC